ncbi:MAG: hypothetical protein K0S32_189 [Bacteroidetes bacterium]|jgi:hypothetical protein|nr:hypothetical protein [Bacteroidota bacterium]
MEFFRKTDFLTSGATDSTDFRRSGVVNVALYSLFYAKGRNTLLKISGNFAT